jgi:hypothetical protein
MHPTIIVYAWDAWLMFRVLARLRMVDLPFVFGFVGI